MKYYWPFVTHRTIPTHIVINVHTCTHKTFPYQFSLYGLIINTSVIIIIIRKFILKSDLYMHFLYLIIFTEETPKASRGPSVVSFMFVKGCYSTI